MFELLSVQPGFNGSTFWFIGDTSTYCQACPVECYSSEEKARAAIEKHNAELIQRRGVPK
jgi:hypothetical protein